MNGKSVGGVGVRFRRLLGPVATRAVGMSTLPKRRASGERGSRLLTTGEDGRTTPRNRPPVLEEACSVKHVPGTATRRHQSLAVVTVFVEPTNATCGMVVIQGSVERRQMYSCSTMEQCRASKRV
jgi:hypothetical protein